VNKMKKQGWKKESSRHSLARNGIQTKNKIKLPKELTGEHLQWNGIVDGEYIEIYRDEDATGSKEKYQYAIFSNKGFLAWVEFGFGYPELEQTVHKWKNEPISYIKALREMQKGD
jgi:hypothetical protein